MDFGLPKTLLLILLLVVCGAGCKKVKEEALEETALTMLHGTEWKITLFKSGNTDITGDFSTYRFRFNRDETVNAIRNNNTEATGNWQGNLNNRTIFASFAAAAAHPLPMLNATWSITQSTMQSLSATTTVGTEMRQLRMEKL